MSNVLIKQVCTQIQNGISSDLFDVTNELGVGVSNPPLVYYEVIPLAPSNTLICVQQAFNNAGSNVNIPLNFPSPPVYYNGVPVIVLDCQRGVEITFTSLQNIPINILVSGYDARNIYIQQIFVCAALQSSTVLDMGNQTFSMISSVVVVTQGSLGQISVGTDSTIGLPHHACLRVEHIISMSWNQVNVVPTIFTTFTPAHNWRTSAPSNVTHDARGSIILPSAPNGANLFTILYYQYGSDSRLQALLANNDYTAYTLIGNPPIPSPVVPIVSGNPPASLVPGDETGIVYPGQMNEYNAYFNLPV